MKQDEMRRARRKDRAMETGACGLARWLDTATRGIRFKPDRAAVRAELAAHLERQHLLSPSQLVFSTPEYGQGTDAVSRRDRTVTALDGTQLYLEDCWFAGVTEETAVVASVERGLLLADDGRLRGYARNGEPLLLPLSQSEWEIPRAYWVEADYSVGAHYTYHNVVPFLLLDVTEGTRRVELSLELRQETGTQRLPYQTDSWDLGGGVWLVGAWREDGVSPSPWLEGSYTLRLYDERDTLLKQQQGAIPSPYKNDRRRPWSGIR